MNSRWSGTAIWRAWAAGCTLLIALPASFAQGPADVPAGTPDAEQTASVLSADQLDALVAPVALYPDPLLSQVLAASTYPLEVVEAQQFVAQSGNLSRAQLMEAAKRQNWDPSVQALVAFPDALTLLANHIRWTTDLGNAFLAQQADVMSAVQRMRAEARVKGRLATTPQQVVTVNAESGENAIAIAPADPRVIYVPIYRPAYIWGPPIWGAYPDLWYPDEFSFGFGFGPGIYMGAYFPSWTGWSGWGWGCAWPRHSLFVNTVFFDRYRFHGGYFRHFGAFSGHGFVGRAAWTHDPGHRLGIPYPNRTLATRFHSTRFGSSRFGSDRRYTGQFAGARAGGGGWNGGRFDTARPGTSQFNRAAIRGGSGARSAASGEWRRFGDGNRLPERSGGRGLARSSEPGFRSSSRGDRGSYRQPSPNYAANGGSRASYPAPAQSYRGSGWAQGYRSSSPVGRSFSPGYAVGRSGEGSMARSYSAPRSGGGPSVARSYAAPSHTFSAPRSFSGPRASGGGSGFSGGHSGASGHSGGGGHRR